MVNAVHRDYRVNSGSPQAHKQPTCNRILLFLPDLLSLGQFLSLSETQIPFLLIGKGDLHCEGMLKIQIEAGNRWIPGWVTNQFPVDR